MPIYPRFAPCYPENVLSRNSFCLPPFLYLNKETQTMLSTFGARSKLLRHAATRPAVILAVLLLIGSLLAGLCGTVARRRTGGRSRRSVTRRRRRGYQFWDMVWGPPEMRTWARRRSRSSTPPIPTSR